MVLMVGTTCNYRDMTHECALVMGSEIPVQQPKDCLHCIVHNLNINSWVQVISHTYLSSDRVQGMQWFLIGAQEHVIISNCYNRAPEILPIACTCVWVAEGRGDVLQSVWQLLKYSRPDERIALSLPPWSKRQQGHYLQRTCSGPHGSSSNQTPLNQFVGVMSHNLPILTCSWLPFIRIDNQVLWTNGGLDKIICH